jgi:D-aminoacyl-tRNA deacylase
MRAVVQRVSRAEIRVEGAPVARCGRGAVVLLGIAAGDGPESAARLAAKVAHLRVFPDDEGRFAHSLLETEGEALVVSQFTLLANTRKGRRPSFTDAAHPDAAEPLVRAFAEALAALGVAVETGVFGARMEVELVNDGPVTILLEM